MSELKPRRARANAFGAERTDLDDVQLMGAAPPPLGDLMPKRPRDEQRSRTRADDHDANGPAAPPATEDAGGAQPRGRGGRPPGNQIPNPTGRSGVSKRPARVPSTLYVQAEPLVKGVGRPSWGQLISWTCATKGEEVVAAVLEQLRPADPLAPRGSNRAGGTTTTIIPQFLGEEIDPVENVHARAQEAVSRDPGIPLRAQRVTATAVIIAAVEVTLNDRGN